MEDNYLEERRVLMAFGVTCFVCGLSFNLADRYLTWSMSGATPVRSYAIHQGPCLNLLEAIVKQLRLSEALSEPVAPLEPPAYTREEDEAYAKARKEVYEPLTGVNDMMRGSGGIALECVNCKGGAYSGVAHRCSEENNGEYGFYCEACFLAHSQGCKGHSHEKKAELREAFYATSEAKP